MSSKTSQNTSLPAEKPAPLAVLVVDDEPLIRWSLRQALIDRGHSVATAATGADALKEITRAVSVFNVVILDYRLPDRQDLTLLDDVRRMSPESVVVMMTAFGDDNMRTGAAERGAHSVVDKPFQVTNLVSLLESAAAG
jgi:DNA-binding NtrC family response regulator